MDDDIRKMLLKGKSSDFIKEYARKEKGMDTARLKMAAICSVCSEPFVKHVKSFAEYLSKSSN